MFVPGVDSRRGRVVGRDNSHRRHRHPRRQSDRVVGPLGGRLLAGFQQHESRESQRRLRRLAVRPRPVGRGRPALVRGDRQFVSATYYFRTAGTVADGSNIEVDLGTTTGDDRNTFMAITNRADADGGLQIRMAEPNPADPGNDFFFPTQIVATNLTRGTWHRIDIQASFIDAPPTIPSRSPSTALRSRTPLPGSPNIGTPNWGTFEGYRDGHGFAYAQSNRLYFRSGAAPSGLRGLQRHGCRGLRVRRPQLPVLQQRGPRHDPRLVRGHLRGGRGDYGGRVCRR